MSVRQDWETLKQQLQAANALVQGKPTWGRGENRGQNRSRDRPRRRRWGRDQPPPSRWLQLLQQADEYFYSYSCDVTMREGNHSFGRPACLRWNSAPHRPTFRYLTYVCAERTLLLDEKLIGRYWPLLLCLSAHHQDWVRSLEEWEPASDDPAGQFTELVHRLFRVHDVPRFLEAAWLKGLTTDGMIQQNWYKHISSGKSIRTAKWLPWPMTRGMAHHFLQAPDDADANLAMSWARVRDLGADESIAWDLARMPIGAGEFWDSVLRWLGRYPMLTRDERSWIVAYVRHQKFVPSVFDASRWVRGQPRDAFLIPAQPHLQMKGRIVSAMLRDVERWRRDLAKPAPVARNWPASGIAPLSHVVGIGADRKYYLTAELTSWDELSDEGDAMHHCVGSYAVMCRSGVATIWSMTVQDAAGQTSRLLTLQEQAGRVVQVRGHCNRLPTSEEVFIIEQWARSGGPFLNPSACRLPA